jgi:hypothetical protein
MELLCLGDVALVDKQLNTCVWNNPILCEKNEDTRVLFNWELPIGEGVNPIPRDCGGPRLTSFPGSTSVIHGWAPGFATLATNHLLDAETAGLIETLASLKNEGFIPVGAGLTLEEIIKPISWETKEGKLAIINWVFPETEPDWLAVPGPNCWPGIDQAIKMIKASKLNHDWVMVVVHWSDELFPYPRPLDRAVAEKLAKSGLDILIGHHPHVVRGMEIISNCPVYYSLGNFFFSNFSSFTGDRFSKWAPRNREALGVQITFKRGERPICKERSFWQENDHSEEDHSQRAINRMKSTSIPLIKYINGDYEDWYKTKRERFLNYWARWHFGIRRLGLRGILRYFFSKVLANIQETLNS